MRHGTREVAVRNPSRKAARGWWCAYQAGQDFHKLMRPHAANIHTHFVALAMCGSCQNQSFLHTARMFITPAFLSTILWRHRGWREIAHQRPSFPQQLALPGRFWHTAAFNAVLKELLTLTRQLYLSQMHEVAGVGVQCPGPQGWGA